MPFQLRILHISDSHFRSPDGAIPSWRREQVLREQWRRELVLGDEWVKNLTEVAKSGRAVDFVCITGDLADWGLQPEYARATGWLKKLLLALGVPPERLFLVPGNHDIHQPTEKASWEKLREIATKTDPERFSDWIAGGDAPPGAEDDLPDTVLRRGQAWRQCIHHDLGLPWLVNGSSGHPRLGYRHELRLAGIPFPIYLIGLDSAWLAGDSNDAGKLRVTVDQVGQNATIDGRPLDGLRIALVHHPLTDLGDGVQVWPLLARYADLLLRGHQHEPMTEVRRNPDFGLVELAAGCLYEGSDGPRYPNGFQVIDITADVHGRPTQYDIWFRSWSPRGGFWHDDSSIYRNVPGGKLTLDGATPGSARESIPAMAPPQGQRVLSEVRAVGDISARDVEVVVGDASGGQILSNLDAGGSIDLRKIRIRTEGGDGGT